MTSSKLAILYGSTTGNTARVAELVAQLWSGPHEIELIDIADQGVTPIMQYQRMILAAPTWDFGELQQDWSDEWQAFCDLDFSAKVVALFGVGDQLGYPDYFQDAMGLIANQITRRGGHLIGAWPNEGYQFHASLALDQSTNHFVGLALDEDSQSWATQERLESWLIRVQAEFIETEKP